VKQEKAGIDKQNGDGKAKGSEKGVLEKQVYFYHPDHLGSTSYVTDAKGDVYQHVEYFPFGESWVEQVKNAQQVAFGFTGKELDAETGLYYFGARYYDARTSVWVSPDPILGEYLPTGDKKKDKNLPGMGGVFNSFNLGLYTYGHLNPVKFVDPDGNQIDGDSAPSAPPASPTSSNPKTPINIAIPKEGDDHSHKMALMFGDDDITLLSSPSSKGAIWNLEGAFGKDANITTQLGIAAPIPSINGNVNFELPNFNTGVNINCSVTGKLTGTLYIQSKSKNFLVEVGSFSTTTFTPSKFNSSAKSFDIKGIMDSFKSSSITGIRLSWNF